VSCGVAWEPPDAMGEALKIKKKKAKNKNKKINYPGHVITLIKQETHIRFLDEYLS